MTAANDSVKPLQESLWEKGLGDEGKPDYRVSEGAYFRVGGVASNSNSIPLNPPSKGGLPIRFPP